MDATPRGDPARELTREDVKHLHAAMVAAEPDWWHQSNVLASALDGAIARIRTGADAAPFRTVVNSYRRDVEAWHRLADDYFEAMGGPITELLPLELDDPAEPG